MSVLLASAGRDEHAPPAVRAAAHLCLLHGAAPERHPDPADRTRGCTPTWPQARDAWTRDLAPPWVARAVRRSATRIVMPSGTPL
ncbi:hypothetical protein [Streptomyces sp. NPDC002209]|uniref:hypothetical protein n=1 Tax=Streptomyces sp. NPDC002209 TaxID=3364638 RepID=UPI0036B38E84